MIFFDQLRHTYGEEIWKSVPTKPNLYSPKAFVIVIDSLAQTPTKLKPSRSLLAAKKSKIFDKRFDLSAQTL